MGCGCSGSTPRAATNGSTPATEKTNPDPTAADQMSVGGPGTPGYTWNGPTRRDEEK